MLSLLPIGLNEATTQLAYEVVFRKRHIQGLLKARRFRGRRNMLMHLGCGPNLKDGWVNIDLNVLADVTLDVRERLPFADGAFSRIYSEHFYEHFNYPRDITHLISECYRVLEPGGLHSFGVPDGGAVLRHYTTREYADHAAAQLYWNPKWCQTQMDHVNYCMRQNGEHRWYYDEETMGRLLQSVGFEAIQRREFDPELDQEKRKVGTLYMQCMKPQAYPFRSSANEQQGKLTSSEVSR
ncbi:MAG TPA: methyltransferase domain-containing protein [Bryobacteraceae bacterium]